jgi:hypothetical protein
MEFTRPDITTELTEVRGGMSLVVMIVLVLRSLADETGADVKGGKDGHILSPVKCVIYAHPAGTVSRKR